MKTRLWMAVTTPLPQGVARGWFAVENGMAVAGVFQLVGAADRFMTSIHVLGEAKPRVEQGFTTFQAAQDHLSQVLNGCIPIYRRLAPQQQGARHG